MSRANLMRSCMHQPAAVIADEPTAALDQETSVEVIKLLTQHKLLQDRTLVVVSHDINIAQYFNRTYKLTNRILEKQDVEST